MNDLIKAFHRLRQENFQFIAVTNSEWYSLWQNSISHCQPYFIWNNPSVSRW